MSHISMQANLLIIIYLFIAKSFIKRQDTVETGFAGNADLLQKVPTILWLMELSGTEPNSSENSWLCCTVV